MFTLNDFKVGDVIEYIAFGNDKRIVSVTNIEDDIKNGRSGFDGYELQEGYNVWGYCDQITRIISRA